METYFTGNLKPLLDAIASEMTLFVPVEKGNFYSFAGYDPATGDLKPEFNQFGVCSPVKEFLFPMRQIAAVFPEPAVSDEVKPFAVFGLKDCDLRAIEILDKVFDEPDFKDPFYLERRNRMFIVSTDCDKPKESCFCNLMGGSVYPQKGYDLNISRIKEGFIIQVGSQKGGTFIASCQKLFAEVPTAALAQRDANRAQAQKLLEQYNEKYRIDSSLRDVVEQAQRRLAESDIFDAEAEDCVECQACTRICPTCHCFYLYDLAKDNRYAKAKMWDSCLRLDYASVAGGENPRKILTDRTRHRLLHKFVYFSDRYGIQMCVGCGRCIDACAGQRDLRDVLNDLNERFKAGTKKSG